MNMRELFKDFSKYVESMSAEDVARSINDAINHSENSYIITDKKCPRCNGYLYCSDLPQYDYVCFECDENFFEVEV